ncbi:MAG: response regulator, partial [Pseudomonadales bacterium]|nr:response regulator [Pseudomonadales bacterium]
VKVIGQGREVFGRKKDGSVFPIEVTLNKYQLGVASCFSSIVRDLSELKDDKQKIRALGEQLTTLGDALPVIIYARDSSEDYRFTYISDKVKEITGFEPQDFTQKESFWIDRIHPDDKGKILIGSSVLTSKDAYEEEYRFQNVVGDYIWFRSVSRVVRGANGAPEYIIGLLEDITVRKRSDEALLKSQAEAEKANKAKSTFLSRMSHELRTPLNAILGFAELQGRYIEDNGPPGLPRSRKHILTAGQHLLMLIEDIFDLIKIEQDELNIPLETTDLNRIIAESLAMVIHEAEKHSISFDYEETKLFVNANTRRLKQAIVNLLTNAIKYNRVGGSVGVKVKEEDDCISVSVEDTGVGMKPSELEEIFNPFSRLPYAEQSEIEGTGIGLALTKMLVEQMQGCIECESSPGQGSQFTLRLQKAERPSRSRSAYQESPLDLGENRVITMLYIEDDLASQELMQMVMAEYPGMRLLVASSAEEGLDIARKLRPDLIFFDINLPKISGVTAMETLKNDERFQNTRMVALSADACPRKIEMAMQAGFDQYLTKPIEISQLYTELDIFKKSMSENNIITG